METFGFQPGCFWRNAGMLGVLVSLLLLLAFLGVRRSTVVR